MKIVITTLSIGENYTKDYTLRMIEDVLDKTDIPIYITTDCINIIKDKFGTNERIKIRTIDRSDIKVSLQIGKNPGTNHFNFNMRYLCLEHVMDLDDTIVIFTDCDNSFDWWDDNIVNDFFDKKIIEGYDYFAPRTNLKLKQVVEHFNENCKKDPNFEYLDYDSCTILWEKFYNYDLIDFETNKVSLSNLEGWGFSSIPSEYLVIFYNKNCKLKKMVSKWKWFHDYLCSKEFVWGTWAEGFEIGVSSFVAEFKDFDITYSHPIWCKVFTPNGYKTGVRGGIVHATEL